MSHAGSNKQVIADILQKLGHHDEPDHILVHEKMVLATDYHTLKLMPSQEVYNMVAEIVHALEEADNMIQFARKSAALSRDHKLINERLGQ